ncbi:MAG: hypothetical protein MUC94_07265 [bacterium]|nr:hypothetical protein [bacterium]
MKTAIQIKSLFILAAGLAFVILISCEMDHGIEPIRSGISGTIHYVGDWPQNTAEVRIVAATKFPPTDLNDLIIGDILATGGDSAAYTFYLDPGEYYLGLVWRKRNAAWGIQSIFGIYLEQGNPFSPGLIAVPDQKTIINGKDITADFAHAKRATTSSISGTVKFNGNWPQNVENFMVIASTQFPPQSLLDFAFSSLLPANVDSTNFSISAAPDTYRAIGVVIKIVDKPWALDNIVGILLKPGSFELQEIVVPTDTSQIAGVNINVYFSGQ